MKSNPPMAETERLLVQTFELYVRDLHRRIIFSFKTEDDLYAVFVGLPIEELGEVRRDIEGAFMRSLEPSSGLQSIEAEHSKR
jgi:hypothetical protein